ncbi:MAG: hypothetical protein Q9160_004246 [Pyrenula sp. 1 TL-2023]
MDISFIDFTLRVGPIGTYDRIEAACRSEGFGLSLSINIARCFRTRLEGAVMSALLPDLSSRKMTLSWELDCPRVVSRSAKVFRCIEAGSIKEIRCLFATKIATARDTTSHGTTPLHLAALSDRLDMVKLLIQEGGDVNAVDDYGGTPLHRAVSKAHNYDIAKLLIENGSDLGNVSLDQRTPLHTLFNDTVQTLFVRESFVDTFLPDSEGMSILHYLAWTSKSSPNIFEKCLQQGVADPWSVDCTGKTCIHYAAMRGNVDLLKYLLSKATQTQIQARDNVGQTALHLAVQTRRTEAIAVLVSGGLKPYVRDRLRRTVLHCAAKCGNLEAVQKLLTYGKETALFLPDETGALPSQLASGQNTTTIREYLRSIESTVLSQHQSHGSSVNLDKLQTCRRSNDLTPMFGVLSLTIWPFLVSKVWVYMVLVFHWIALESASGARNLPRTSPPALS